MEKGAKRTPSTLVREGIGAAMAVGTMKGVVEREGEDAVEIATLPTLSVVFKTEDLVASTEVVTEVKSGVLLPVIDTSSRPSDNGP